MIAVGPKRDPLWDLYWQLAEVLTDEHAAAVQVLACNPDDPNRWENWVAYQTFRQASKTLQQQIAAVVHDHALKKEMHP